MKKLNGESGWKASFCSNHLELRRGNLLRIYVFVFMIYKARSSLNIFKCLYYSLVYSHLSYCTVSWGRTYLTELNCLPLLQKRVLRIMAPCIKASEIIADTCLLISTYFKLLNYKWVSLYTNIKITCLLIYMTPISQTSERPIDIVHVQDQTKICLYLGEERIYYLWQIQFDLPQPIIGIKYLNI